MGNFLAILASESWQAESTRLFDSGLQIARSLKNPEPAKKISTDSVRAAAFPRHNGSGGDIVRDKDSGDWLFAVGSWFHSSGIGPGEERGLLQRFQQVGPVQLARELEGFFTLFIGDGHKGPFLVITDIVGSCHAFSRQFPHAVAIAGSSLLLAGLQKCSLDPIACQEFVHTGIVYEDRTLFTEVRKLAPATVFWFAEGKLEKQERYWDPAALEPESLRADTAVEMLHNAVTTSAKTIARVFPNPVCDLTGGYDSRAVVAAFLSSGATFATTVSGPAESGDVTVSKSLAALLGVPHSHFAEQPVSPFDEIKEAVFFTDGEYEIIDYARVLRIHQTLADQFQISINGSFGELARGYWWELLVPHTGKRGRLDAAKLARARYAPGTVQSKLFRANLRIEMVPHFTRVVEQNNSNLFDTPNTFQMDSAYLGMRMQRWQGRIATSTNRLWPCLSPFIFRSTLEIILQTENSLRKRSLMIRKWLHKRQPRLAAFPLEHGYPAEPASLTNAHRFLPLVNYYGAKVRHKVGFARHAGNSTQTGAKPPRLKLWDEPEVKAMLQSASMKSANLFDPIALDRFLSRSRETNFSEDSEWRRLLTLECALQKVQI